MTDKLRQAAELALHSLERWQVKRQDFDRFAIEIEELRQALAEPDTEVDYWRKKAEYLEQENFAWRTKIAVRGYEIEIESLREGLEESQNSITDVVEPEKWDHPPHRNCECKHCKEYWVNQYRDEQYNLIDKFLRNHTDDEWYDTYRNALDRIYHAPYVTPPKREWQWLTEEDIHDLFMANETVDDYGEFESIACTVSAKLKEKNHG